jgi:hypothetical protein
MFSNTILGNVGECRTECEISDNAGAAIAVVYETHQGWCVDILRELRDEESASFNASVEAAKQSLSHYVNRRGSNPPVETTMAGLSLWLMQKDDGTALGIDLKAQSSQPGPPLQNVSPDLKERIRSIARGGRPVEAIRELRIATACTLEQAKAWLKDNC